MRKLILILLFISAGCGYNAIDNTKYVVIYKIISDYDGGGGSNSKFGCYYYVHGNTHYRVNNNAYFFDECGKFTVGDTIQIIKATKP